MATSAQYNEIKSNLQQQGSLTRQQSNETQRSTQYNEIKKRLQQQGGFSGQESDGTQRSDQYNEIKKRLQQQGGISKQQYNRNEYVNKLFTDALESNGGAAVYYARAVDQMKAAGVNSGVMSGLLKEKDWKALQDQAIKNYNSKTGALNLAAVAYDNYTEYLRAYVSMATNIKNANNVQGIDLPEGYESTGNAAFDIFTAEYLRRVQNEDPAAKKFKETATADHTKEQADRAEAYVREVSHWNDRANEINLMGTAGNRIPQQDRSMLEWIGNTYGNTSDALAAAKMSATQTRRLADNLVATNRAVYADDFSEKSVFDSAVTDETYRKTNTRGEDNFLEDQEIAVYNYIYATEGAAKAQAYLDTLVDELNKRKGQSKADSVDGNFLGQMWVKAQSGFDQFGSGIASLFNDGQPKDPSVIQYASAAVDEDLAEVDLKWYNFADKQWKDQDIFGRSLGQMAGDTVQTTANMLPSIGASAVISAINPTAGAWAGAILMGSSAAGNAYQDMLNQGYSKGSAATYGTLVGISEALLEKVLGGISPISGGGGLQKLTSKFAKVDSVLKRFADSAGGKILLNAGSEAVEEGLQSVLEPFFKTIVTGEEFTVDMEEALYSALLGFVTGGMFEGVSTTDNSLRTNTQAKRLYGGSQQELVAEVLALNPGNAFALKMQGLLDKGKKLTGSQLNKLVQMNEAAIKQGTPGAEAAQQAQEGVNAITDNVPAANVAEPQGLRLPSVENDVKPQNITQSDPNVTVSSAPDVEAPQSASISVAERLRQEQDLNGGTQHESTYERTADSIDNESSPGLLFGGQGRIYGESPGRSTGDLVRGAGRTQRETEQRATASRRQSIVNAQEIPPVSSASLGIRSGSQSATLRVMPEELWDDAMKNTAERIRKETGKRVTYVIGGLMIDGPDGAHLANGAWNERGIVIRADHMRFSIDQIADHELFHDLAFRTPGLIRQIEEAIHKRYGDEQLAEVVNVYTQKLAQLPENATPAQIEAAARMVLEEIWADAYAGVNRFSADAVQFQDDVKQKVAETVQPVDQTQENGVRETVGPPIDRFLYAGKNANNANLDTLARAKEMRADGVADETIRQQTGWYVGMDGKWRWEIDDSRMEYSSRGDLGLRERRPDYARYRELLDKANRHALELSDEALTPEEAAELQKLKDIWGRTFRTAGRITEDALQTELLSDYVKHDALFEAYPQMRKTRLRFADMPEGARGQYDPEQDIVTISEKLRGKPQDTLVHEIQHAIQRAEGFASGSSLEYWMTRLDKDRQQEMEIADKKYRDLFDSMPEELKNRVRAYNRANLDYDYDEAIAIEEDLLEGEYAELFSAWMNADFERRNLRERYKAADLTEDARANYRNTAGEIEARNAADRRTMTQEQRKNTPPDLGGEDTVFVDGDSGVGYSIVEPFVDSNGTSFDAAVLLDTTFFDGLSPRNWGKKLKEFVELRAKTNPVILPVVDETGSVQQLQFANPQDRVTKVGRSNHKVLDELSSGSDNISKLAVVHIDEVIEVSEADLPYYTVDNTHQWLDQNGWLHRKANVINAKNGNIYSLTLDIAKARDGRHILYATKGNINRVGNVQVNSLKIRGSGQNSNSESIVSHSENDVKNRFMVDDSEVDTLSEEQLKRVKDLEYVPMYRPGMKRGATDAATMPDGYTSAEDFVADAEKRAAATRAELMRNLTKEEFKGTEALEKLGIRVENSVGNYSMVKSMIANDRSAKSILKELRRAEIRLGATPGEKKYASGIAEGFYSNQNIPQNMDADKVLELADYLWVVKAMTSDTIKSRRDAINQTLLHKMERIMQRVDTAKIKIPRAFTLHHRTPTRNMITIFGDEIGGQLNDFLFNPVAVNEAERYRFINRMYDEVRKLKGKDGKTKKLNKAERALVQQVIEGKAVEETVAGMEMGIAIKNAAHNIRNGEDAGDAAREFSLSREERKLAVQYSRWMQTQEALKSDKVDVVRVNNAVEKYTELFGQFYDAINDFLVAHGYEPIGFIKGYTPHLQPEANQTALRKALEKLGLSPDVSTLPTNIAGLTKDYKPNKRWNPYFLTRHSDITQFDIVTAFESYVDYMSDVLYHTDDIMRVRQASTYFRKTFAPEENRELIGQAMDLRYGTVDAKLDFLRANGEIGLFSFPSAEDINTALDDYIEKLLGNLKDKTVYSDFVMWLDDYANKLAGKQLMADRDMERTMGRTSLNVVSRLSRAFARAQVAGSFSSALNQQAQIPQIIGENGVQNTARAVKDVIDGKLTKAAWLQESDFLTEKKGVNYIASTPGEMLVSGTFKPLEWVDGFVSALAVRGRYLKEVAEHKSHSEAMKAADNFGRRVMGSRAKGSIPLAFQSKGIVSQFFHLFQVEAANSWEHLVVDLPQDFRQIQATAGVKAASGALAGVIVKTLIAAFLLNRFDEELYGGTPAPYDLIGLTANFIASGQGLSTNEFLKTLIDNCWQAITGERLFDTDQEPLSDGKFDLGSAAKDTWYNVSNDIPYLRNAFALLGWGDDTLPIPDLWGAGKNIYNAATDEDAGVFSYDMLKALTGLAGEFVPGGHQADKTITGIETAIRGGKYKGIGENSRLQYPVDVDPWTALKLALFGDAAASERNEFYASGDSALAKKQTKVYEMLVAGGANAADVYDAIQQYRKIDNDKSLSSVERGKQCRDIIRNMEISDDLKLEMYLGLTDAESTAEHFRVLMNEGLSWNQVMDAYDKYSELKNNEDLYASDQATAFAKWVDDQGYTPDQEYAIKDQLLFWNMFPAQAYQYEKFTEAGLAQKDAHDLTGTLSGLQPNGDEGRVTDIQRWRACVNYSNKEATQLAALAGVMTDKQYAKVNVAYEYDVSPAEYVTLRETLVKYDANGNGSLSNSEVTDAINSLRGLSKKQKAVLWQLSVSSKSAKNNPYSPEIGEQVLKALSKE